jgi:hypothetical protein
MASAIILLRLIHRLARPPNDIDYDGAKEGEA